ncbi:hypothetical protein CI109_105410 [Kwoniella shandongensis]|uniref:Uncharacterized protein n=1 Tax=Kwoniella shandongensis TaxID=1734106 RepID=A0A5M6BNT5_9TREE|nr:uncharacterized protein CI109_007284 [Kwoniella shandongensis]KAA5524373.1 hypothetical protein CI109_007284 [Kwoniella shandongensis]
MLTTPPIHAADAEPPPILNSAQTSTRASSSNYGISNLPETTTATLTDNNDDRRNNPRTNVDIEKMRDAEVTKPRGWKERSEYWTWNCYTVNMGTGAVSILIGGIPFEMLGASQRIMGTIFYLLNIVLFVFNTSGVLSRLIFHPRAFFESFYDHTDGIYVPCFALAIAGLFVGSVNYAAPYVGFWFTRTLYVIWIFYIILNISVAMILENTMRGRRQSLETITPADSLLVLSTMIAGTLGSALAPKLPLEQAGYVICVSYMLQGMGFWISILKLSLWQSRTMLLPNPEPSSLPGYMIAVGPPGFTAFAFLHLADTAKTAFPASGILSEGAGEMFVVINVWFALMLIGMGLYIYLSTLAVWIGGMVVRREVKWSMGWWSFTFPLVGIFMAFAQLGKLIPSKTCSAVQVFGCFFVSIFWCINITMTVYSVFIARTVGMPKPPQPNFAAEAHQPIDGYHQGSRSRVEGDSQIRQRSGAGAAGKEWARNSIDA